MQIAGGQVGQVVDPLVGTQQVSGQLGVAGQPGQLPAARPQRQHRPLGVVDGLGHARIGQPGGQRGIVVGRQFGDLDEGGVAVGGSQRDSGQVAGTGPPLAGEVEPDHPGASMSVQPGSDRAGGQRLAGHLEAAGGLRLTVRQVLQQPVAQHPELQAVEQRVHRLAIPVAAGQLVHGNTEVEIADERVQFPVAGDVGQMCAQRLAGLAGH